MTMKLVQYVVLRGDLGWPTGALIGELNLDTENL